MLRARQLLLSVALLLPACSGKADSQGAESAKEPASRTVAAIAPSAAAHPDGEWHIPAGDFASSRYSGLEQITARNVARLEPAFIFETGFKRGHEAAPLVVGSTMFLITPFPNVVYALDLTKPNAPVKWKFEPKPDPAAQGKACCDVVNRGMSYHAGSLFMVTLDGQVIAIDAASGSEVWRTPIADISEGETVTMAPLGGRRKGPCRQFGRRIRRARGAHRPQ